MRLVVDEWLVRQEKQRPSWWRCRRIIMAKHGFIRGGGCAKSFRDPPKHYVLFLKIPIKRRKKSNEAEIVIWCDDRRIYVGIKKVLFPTDFKRFGCY